MPDIMVIGARGIPDVEGGAEKHAENIFPLLAQLGYSVEIVGINQYISRKDYKGVALTGLPTLRLMRQDKVIYNFLALLHALIKRPKLVHLQSITSGPFLIFYKLFGIRVVLRYGSSDIEYDKWGTVARSIFRFCEYQLRFADRVIAVSEKFKKDLQTRAQVQRVDVVPNGVDTVELTAESQHFWAGLNLEKNKYVLTVGRLTADKNFETLIRAVELLADDKIKLVIAGGPAEKGYSERLRSLSSERVIFTGRVDRSLLPALYANCAAYVNCSRHEGQSNAVLEAISCRCPLIASDIPANIEMPLKAQSYFPVGDAKALALKLHKALNQPSEFVADTEDFWDWPSVAARTDEIYSIILAKRSSRSWGWLKPIDGGSSRKNR